MGLDSAEVLATIEVIRIVNPDPVDLGERRPFQAAEPFTGESLFELRLLPGLEHQVRLPAVSPQERHRVVQAPFLDVGPAERRASGVEPHAAAVMQGMVPNSVSVERIIGSMR